MSMASLPPIVDLPPPALPLRVVGDVHLCLEEPEVMAGFLAWLERLEGSGGSLILLGDIFDLWVGRPQQHDPLPKYVLQRIARVVDAGTKVYFMAGNRDLAFKGVDGVEIEVLADPVRTTVAGRTVVFTHGDQLCTADTGYQAMRRFLYGPGGTALELFLPYRGKRWLGEGMRNLSMRETGRKSRASMDIDYGEALGWMEGYGADAIVAGHVHTGVRHRHPGPPEREIIVLKDWERGGSVVTFEVGETTHTRP
jgi:UDP-2,3-diacylglucosamine hydrolase